MEKYGKDLLFISQINRDGGGTTKIKPFENNHNKTVLFTLYSLSLSQKTYIATDKFNWYVVKI